MKLSKAQAAIFEYLADHAGLSCSDAIHVGANGRTIDAMRKRGWLVERYYPNGPRVWELTNDGIFAARQALGDT